MENNNQQNNRRKAGKTDTFRSATERIVKEGNKQYQSLFLVNNFPSSRNGKVVYIRPEYHERLQRIVQLDREEKITLYSYIDNILEQHFKEFGDDIVNYYHEKIKPIL